MNTFKLCILHKSKKKIKKLLTKTLIGAILTIVKGQAKGLPVVTKYAVPLYAAT